MPPSLEEIVRLLAVADRSLADAAVPGVSADARVGFAHTAVIAAAAAALSAEGYRVMNERHHERLLDSLRYTVGIERRLLNQLHDVRSARNALTYDRVGDTTAVEADVIVARAAMSRKAVTKWLGSAHPELRPGGSGAAKSP